MSLHVLLIVAALVCALMAVRARPLIGALWLAALSALVAILLYLLGAPEIAVIELSVGAGLITVLLAFAISMAEDETMPVPLLPRPFAALIVMAACGALLWLLLPAAPAVGQVAEDAPFINQVWEARLLDLGLQIVIIIGGVIGVLSLLGETRRSDAPVVEKSR